MNAKVSWLYSRNKVCQPARILAKVQFGAAKKSGNHGVHGSQGGARGHEQNFLEISRQIFGETLEMEIEGQARSTRSGQSGSGQA